MPASSEPVNKLGQLGQMASFDDPSTSTATARTSASQSRNNSDNQAWTQWDTLTVSVEDLPHNVVARDVWIWFSQYGTIVWIDVSTTRGKAPRTTAKVRFGPPPSQAFWNSGKLTVPFHKNTMQHGASRTSLVISVRLLPPIPQQTWRSSRLHADRKYPQRLKMISESLGLGVLTSPTSMKLLRTVRHEPVRLEFDASARRLSVFFFIPGKDSNWRGLREFKLSADVTQMKDMYRTVLPDGSIALVLPLARPPRYFWKMDKISQSMRSDAKTWSQNEAYQRATDVAEDLKASFTYPIAIHNGVDDPQYTEIGRWTTFRFVLPTKTEAEKLAAQHLQDVLEDFNIRFKICPDFEVSPESMLDETIWSYLNHAPVTNSQRGALALLEHSMSRGVHLSFEIRYQLEVCISRGILSEYTITLEFLEHLERMNPVKARLRLEYLADQNKTLYTPMDLFDDPEAEAYQPHLRIPHYCALVRKAVVTPTTIRFSTANPEVSNRVFRQYKSLADRFLRVQFVEESEQSRVYNNPENGAIYQRVLRTLYNGIQIGDRNYEFLAFGSSQLRECGAYFFCPSEHTSCDDIRSWMGEFSHIKIVAKYAARLGQCFSTTREIRGIHMPDIKLIPDVNRNGVCFTDGVGKISKFLSQLIIGEMDLDVFDDPSAFQFRMGGCKGVLTVWPEAKYKEVHIRDSQKKFEAEYNGLEIIRCAGFATATLNRQTITILESLGVPSDTFVHLLQHQLESFQKSMTDKNEAIDMLTQFVDENQTTLIIAELLKGDFRTDTRTEPFVTSILNLWRAWSLKLIKEKARIQVDQSAFVLGCVDETASLRGHDARTEGTRQQDTRKLPQIFLQLSDPKSHKKTHIIEGICIVGRNPSLHPGDIRVVQAVNEPNLHHLKDVVVFPITGDKPVPSMLSGGDLDGDDFFVIWNKKLIPREWNHPPMNYTGSKPKEMTQDITVNQVRDFFVSYMQNDVLAMVAYAHLAHADKLGPKHVTCLKLAEMHSKAVDFAKTGEAVGWDHSFQPRVWPHFMDQKKQTYHSRKALGQIYDKVSGQDLEFIPDQESDFDERIMNKFALHKDMLQSARDIKSQYDMCVRRILAQHTVDTEFELWTGFALSKPVIGSDYKRQEQLGREYDAVKQRFRELCYEAAGGHVADKIEPFVAAMYKVTEEDMKAGTEYDGKEPEGEDGEAAAATKERAMAIPLISFPWIFHWVLIRIAMGDKYKPNKNVMAPLGRKIDTPITIGASAMSGQALAPPTFKDTLEAATLQAADKVQGLSLEVKRAMAEDVVDALEPIPGEGEVVMVIDDDDDVAPSSADLLAQFGGMR